METPKSLDDLIRNAYDPLVAGIKAPDTTMLRARKMVETGRPERPDIFSLLAYFLNLKIKLYHAAIAFLLIWITVLLLGGKNGNSGEDQNAQPYVSSIAAVRNSTILSSCQTFITKK